MITITQVQATKAAAEAALRGFQRVVAASDVATMLKMIDEVEVALERRSFELARARSTDIATLVAQLIEGLTAEERELLQPHTTMFRLLHELLGEVIGGDDSQYELSRVRPLLAELRLTMQSLHARARASGGQ